MNDTIYRQDAIDACRHAWAKGLEPSQYIEIIPSAGPERPKGKWETVKGWEGDRYYRCSECGTVFVLIAGTPKENEYDFCPHCGADNREEDNG